jgi:hypothetical protein
MFAEVTLENLHDVAARGCVSYTAANNVTGAARLTHVFGSLAQILPEHGPEDHVINVLDDEAWNMYNHPPPPLVDDDSGSEAGRLYKLNPVMTPYKLESALFQPLSLEKCDILVSKFVFQTGQL